MSHLENGSYQEEAFRRNESINNSNLSDEISIKVGWLQDNLVEGPQYGPDSVKVFREDIRTSLIEKFGGPISDLEIGVVLRRAFPHHVRRGKFFCGISKRTLESSLSKHNDKLAEAQIETKKQTNSVKEMADSAAAAVTREVQVPMKKRMIIREKLQEERRERPRDRQIPEGRQSERYEEHQHPKVIQKSIPDQQLYKSSLNHVQASQIPPSPHIVVAPSAVHPSYHTPYSQGVVTQTRLPHHFTLPAGVVVDQQRSLEAAAAVQQRLHHFNHYGVAGVPQELLNPFAMVGRPQKRHDHGPPMGDHPSPHKRPKKPKSRKDGQLDGLPANKGGMHGAMSAAMGAAGVQPIILNFDVPIPKMNKVKSLEERLPEEIKHGSLARAAWSGGHSPSQGPGDSTTTVALQDHQVTSEQAARQPDSQGTHVKESSPSERFPGHIQGKPPPFIPKRSSSSSSEEGSSSLDRREEPSTGKEVFKVPSINQYKASTASSSTTSSGPLPVLTCFICQSKLHPGSRDYPPSASPFMFTCLRCKKVAFGKREANPTAIPKFPAACNPRVAPSEEVSALRRRTFWKCLINHHKTTKQMKRNRRIPRVVVNNRARSVSSSMTGSYPPSPQPASPMSTCTAPSPCTSLPPSPRSDAGMSVPGSPISQLPSPSISPRPQEKRSHSLHPPPSPLVSEGHFSGSGGARPVNSPKISSSHNDVRRFSAADPSEDRLDVPGGKCTPHRQSSPGAVSDATMSPDSISLPPGRENDDATVRALLSLSSSSNETKGKLELPTDRSGRRHSSPSIGIERRYSLRDFAGRAADSTECSSGSSQPRVIQDYLDRQDLKYLREDTRQRTFMISGQLLDGGRSTSSRPYEAFCCTCLKEELVFIRCPARGCEFVCNSISSMQLHEAGHAPHGDHAHLPPGSPAGERTCDSRDSRSSVETQSADTDVEAKSPSSMSHFTHSKREEPPPSIDLPQPPLPASSLPLSSSSSVIDLGTTGHHMAISRAGYHPSLGLMPGGRAPEPTSPLDLSGKRQYLGMPISSLSNERTSSPSSPFPRGSPLDLSSQTKHGYSDIVSYQAQNRDKEQFVSNPMLGSTGKLIERPPAPVANLMPSIQIPPPSGSMPMTSVPMTAQLPTLVSPANLPFFYTPFIPYQPAGMPTGIPHHILMGSPSAPVRPEKPPAVDEQHKLYQGPFAFLNQINAAARSRAMAKSALSPSNGPHPGETSSPTSTSSSGSWHRERPRDTSPAASMPHSPQRAPPSVSYQGGTISIQTSPTSLGSHRRISPKTVKIESPFQDQPTAARSPAARAGPAANGSLAAKASPSSTDCMVQVKVEQYSGDEDLNPRDGNPMARNEVPEGALQT